MRPDQYVHLKPEEIITLEEAYKNVAHPRRFLWVKQGLAYNFCHIFPPAEPPHRPGELAARAAPLLRTALSTSRIGGPIVCFPSASLRT